MLNKSNTLNNSIAAQPSAKLAQHPKPSSSTKRGPALINELYDIFRQYPDVFPDAYFRFLKANLEDSINKGLYRYIDGVFLSWKQYKRATDLGSGIIAQPGDYLLDKMVSAQPGRGSGHKVIEGFLRTIVRDGQCYLKVAATNKVAIEFYKKHGFEVVGQTNFGSVPGLIMCLRN